MSFPSGQEGAYARAGPPILLASAEGSTNIIELLDIECALCHVTGVQFDKNICPYKSAILIFSSKEPFAFAQNVLGRANFALINPPFCGDNVLGGDFPRA